MCADGHTANRTKAGSLSNDGGLSARGTGATGDRSPSIDRTASPDPEDVVLGRALGFLRTLQFRHRTNHSTSLLHPPTQQGDVGLPRDLQSQDYVRIAWHAYLASPVTGLHAVLPILKTALRDNPDDPRVITIARSSSADCYTVSTTLCVRC